MLKILRSLLCALMLLSTPSFGAVIIIANNDIEAGFVPLRTASASADPDGYLVKYDYEAKVVATTTDTFLVLPLSTVPEPSSVLMVMIGLGMLGIAAHKQSQPF